jgi:plastocyanin
MSRTSIALTALATVTALAVATGASGAPEKVNLLTGTVGPGFTITLKRGTAEVRTLAAGAYSFVINDRSNIHNFHLTGPGVDRKTTVAFMGAIRWTVKLRAGTYTYLCDPHSTGLMGGQLMRGQFVVRAAK